MDESESGDEYRWRRDVGDALAARARSFERSRGVSRTSPSPRSERSRACRRRRPRAFACAGSRLSRRDEKPKGSPRHRKVVDSLSRSRARRSRFGETIAVGAVPRAPPAVAVSLRETRGRRRRPRPGFTRHRERRDEGAFATRPRSAGGARRARPVVPWTPPPNIAGSRVSFPPDAIAP